MGRELIGMLGKPFRHIPVENNALGRQIDCGLHDLGTCHGSVFFQHIQQAGDAARHAGGQVRTQG